MEKEDEFSDSPDDELETVRIRYFYEFQDPFLVLCSEETTLRNNSDADIRSIFYDIGEFRTRLHIYDSDGKVLEFYRSADEVENSDDAEMEHQIDIEFPYDKPLRPGEYRTIKLEYIREIKNYNIERRGYYVFLFSLEDAPRTYISIRNAKDFRCERKIRILSSDGEEFETKHLREKEEVTEEQFENSINIAVKSPIEQCKLIFAFNYDIDKSLKHWLNLGVGLGVTTIGIIVWLFVTQPGECLQTVIPFAGIVNAFLLIIKGWLFQNKMEKVDKGLCLFDDICISYGTLYICLIAILIIEIALAALLTYIFRVDTYTQIAVVLSTRFTSIH